MAYYSAHYGSWNEPGGVRRVEFGRELGIDHLYQTENFKLAREKAQEAANESGQIVNFEKTIVLGCGRGLQHEWKKVFPVRSKIKFIRSYVSSWGSELFDVIYHSGRVCTMQKEDLPTTAKHFIESSIYQEQQHDRLFNRDETIYY